MQTCGRDLLTGRLTKASRPQHSTFAMAAWTSHRVVRAHLQGGMAPAYGSHLDGVQVGTDRADRERAVRLDGVQV